MTTSIAFSGALSQNQYVGTQRRVDGVLCFVPDGPLLEGDEHRVEFNNGVSTIVYPDTREARPGRAGRFRTSNDTFHNAVRVIYDVKTDAVN